LDTLPETLMEFFSITGIPSLEASYNIAPTQLAPVIRQGDDGLQLVHARWGLVPFWAKDLKIGNRMINARSETAAEKPAFRAAWKKRRCLVPASGFYEWQKTPDGKQPQAIHPARDPLFAFAGLWETWRSPQDETVTSFTILTTRANFAMAPIHDRMPVMITRDDQSKWLRAEDAVPDIEIMAHGLTVSLNSYPISTAVNKPSNNYPQLLEPVAIS
jgi:putative SOS response-associated peptidase YedK